MTSPALYRAEMPKIRPSRIRGARTVIRPATLDDVDRLVAWHADPEVARYWDGASLTREEVAAHLARPSVDPWIVEAGGPPVGYLQSWREDDPPLRGGLDMYLVSAARGRGLGPDAARALAGALVDAGWASVTADPYVWNEHAVAAWQRAGFEVAAECPADSGHDAPWLLMRFSPGPGCGGD